MGACAVSIAQAEHSVWVTLVAGRLSIDLLDSQSFLREDSLLQLLDSPSQQLIFLHFFFSGLSHFHSWYLVLLTEVVIRCDLSAT